MENIAPFIKAIVAVVINGTRPHTCYVKGMN